MLLRNLHFLFVVTLFFFSLSAVATAGGQPGWSGKTKSEMVSGCVAAITKNVVTQVRQQSGLKSTEPLSPEIQEALDTQFVPEFKKACTCTVDNIAAEHSYAEVERDDGILKRAAALIGSPQGCPMNL